MAEIVQVFGSPRTLGWACASQSSPATLPPAPGLNWRMGIWGAGLNGAHPLATQLPTRFLGFKRFSLQNRVA